MFYINYFPYTTQGKGFCGSLVVNYVHRIHIVTYVNKKHRNRCKRKRSSVRRYR